MEDDAIRVLLQRLARPDREGGHVIETAAITAEGADSAEVVAWILAHDGEPEAPIVKRIGSGGLHGERGNGGADGPARPPARFVLPAGTLG